MRPRETGREAVIYRTAMTVDADGNTVRRAVEHAPLRERVTTRYPRYESVETPGSQITEGDLRMNTRPGLEGVGHHSVVYLDGDWWDVIEQPTYFHSAVPRLRHWTWQLRLRASGKPKGWS